MNINIRVPIRLLHAHGSPADTADFFGALVEDVADRDGDVDATQPSESVELASFDAIFDRSINWRH